MDRWTKSYTLPLFLYFIETEGTRIQWQFYSTSESFSGKRSSISVKTKTWLIGLACDMWQRSAKFSRTKQKLWQPNIFITLDIFRVWGWSNLKTECHVYGWHPFGVYLDLGTCVLGSATFTTVSTWPLGHGQLIPRMADRQMRQF